jgi:hypothetical protein
MSFTYYFHGRKPSFNQVAKIVQQAVDIGHDQIDIHWGENWIDLTKSHGVWTGSGWIRDVSGGDIANVFNEKRRQSASMY